MAWRHLSHFRCVGPHLPTVVIQARCLSQITFDDFSEREKRLASFAAGPDGASEATARRVLRHLDRQAGLTHAGSIPQHDNRSVAGQRTINDRANRAAL